MKTAERSRAELPAVLGGDAALLVALSTIPAVLTAVALAIAGAWRVAPIAREIPSAAALGLGAFAWTLALGASVAIVHVDPRPRPMRVGIAAVAAALTPLAFAAARNAEALLRDGLDAVPAGRGALAPATAGGWVLLVTLAGVSLLRFALWILATDLLRIEAHERRRLVLPPLVAWVAITIAVSPFGLAIDAPDWVPWSGAVPIVAAVPLAFIEAAAIGAGVRAVRARWPAG